MIVNNIKSIVFFIIGAILVFLLMKNCSGKIDTIEKLNDLRKIETNGKTIVVKMVTKVDTLYVKKYIHRVDTVRLPTIVKIDTVFIKDTKQVAVIPEIKRVYKDKVKVTDSTSVSYTANVTGTLDKISIEYDDRRAEKTIVRNIEKETTIIKKPWGIYLGVESNLGLKELSPALTLVNNKNIFSVKYNIAGSQTSLQNVGVSYSRKLF